LQRRERLQEIITVQNGIQIRGYVENRGKDLFRLAKEKGSKASSQSGRPALIDLESDQQIVED
jgi:hypothetical protein